MPRSPPCRSRSISRPPCRWPGTAAPPATPPRPGSAACSRRRLVRTMHVFIDESGSFSGYHERSVSVVGALVLPTWKLPIIRSKYAKLRRFLPTDKGEVKGRLMNESQVDKVVTLLRRNDAIFELTAVDLGFQTEDEILNYKRQHA